MQKVISDIIQNRVKDPRIPILTSVTGVKMSPDLSYAKCFISVYGDDEAKKGCMDALEHAKGFIRTEMCKRINLRVAPQLVFSLDTSLEDAARMEAFINKTLEEDRKKREELGI